MVVLDSLFGICIFVVSLIFIVSIIVFIEIPNLNAYRKRISDKVNSEEFIVMEKYKQRRMYSFAKRVFDIVLSVMGLICMSPMMLIICILIKISHNKVLRSKTITGYKGKEIKVYRFNTNKDSGNLLKQFDFVGFSNIPLLFNVLKGDMSIIGISCWESPLDKRYKKVLLEYEKPGMVSLASLYSNEPMKTVFYDSYYLQNRGFSMDRFIMLRAFFIVINAE